MRYLLFGGPYYYAKGGAQDFITAGDDPEELIEQIDATIEQQHPREYLEWWHIYDTIELRIVSGSIAQAYDAPDFNG